MSVAKTETDTNHKISGVQLRPGESVVVAARPALIKVWPLYLVTLGFYTIWRRRDICILTDQRVLLGKGVFSRSERAIPLRRVNDASYSRRGVAGYTEVKYQGGDRQQSVRLGPFQARVARRLAREIEDRV
jgi:hypothetical protein